MYKYTLEFDPITRYLICPFQSSHRCFFFFFPPSILPLEGWLKSQQDRQLFLSHWEFNEPFGSTKFALLSWNQDPAKFGSFDLPVQFNWTEMLGDETMLSKRFCWLHNLLNNRISNVLTLYWAERKMRKFKETYIF